MGQQNPPLRSRPLASSLRTAAGAVPDGIFTDGMLGASGNSHVCDSSWQRVEAHQIEDLQSAVLGAGLDAIQLSRGAMRGSLAVGVSDGIAYSSGLISGQVSLVGTLSDTMVTLGVGVNIGRGSRHWLREVDTGGIGIFFPGHEHDALYTPDSIYACATLTMGRLEEIASEMGLVLDATQLGGTGISPRRVPRATLTPLRRAFYRLHEGHVDPSSAPAHLGRGMLEDVIRILARRPRATPLGHDANSHAKIVRRAQDFILANLEHPLSIRVIANAAFASPSTLYRAFREVLDETPQVYTRKLRLNRIHRDLATEREAMCTIAMIANRWGIGELGKLSGWYRELFDELPSETKRRHRGTPSTL